MEMLQYDQPRSRGVWNVLRRARQFSGFQWTPAQEMVLKQKGSSTFLCPTRSGKPNTEGTLYAGMPYSSCRIRDKFVGLDISVQTFLSALENPASVMYTRDLSDFDDPDFHCAIWNTNLFYGVVCSSFVSYSLDLPIHRCTREMDIAPEFDEITNRNADALALGDALVVQLPSGRTGDHLRIVTGLGRDADGRVRQVEVSEAVIPSAIAKWYSEEEFNATLLGSEKGRYRIFRYRYIDTVREPQSDEVPENRELMLNHGALSNYRVGEPVEFYVNCDADALVIEGSDSVLRVPAAQIPVETVLGNPYRIRTVPTLKPDHYTAYCEKNGEKGTPVRFTVAQPPQVELTDLEDEPFELVALKPVAPDGSPLTKESACFYEEDGTLKTGVVTLALACGDQLLPARAAVREKDGALYARMGAALYDGAGKLAGAFRVGEEACFYAWKLQEGQQVRIHFSGEACCEPSFLSWKEEAAIAYQQRLFSTKERMNGEAECIADRYDNPFAQFVIFSKNEFGTVATDPLPFVFADKAVGKAGGEPPLVMRA